MKKGSALNGFEMQNCPEIFGDKIDGMVRWRKGENLSTLAEQPVRMRIRLRDAHLYAFRFAREQ